ncbi:hypothetical protein BC628DRAFT_742614 [Trametes gibbosa]|nr:hypothetical protein BC628DRAFT_742614 [Trametes gibbosa]
MQSTGNCRYLHIPCILMSDYGAHDRALFDAFHIFARVHEPYGVAGSTQHATVYCSALIMSTVLIPQPENVSRRINIPPTDEVCLAGQMKLMGTEGNRNVYYDICDTVGTLCERYYPHHEELPRDDSHKQLLIEKAIRVHPILKSYENCWPIKPMYQMHRQLRKAGSATGITQRRPTRLAVCISEGRRKIPQSGSRSSPRNSMASDSRREDSRRRKLMPKTDYKKRASQRSKATSTNVVSRSPSTTARHMEKSGNFLRQFLQDLPQDLRCLYSVFVGYGIGNESALRGMRRMQGWRRWLYGWVSAGQLTELQFKMISDGIVALQGRTTVV